MTPPAAARSPDAEKILVDSHVHLDALSVGDQRKWLREARARGVRWAVLPGCGPEQWPRLLDACSEGASASPLAETGSGPSLPRVVGALGLHPYFTDESGMLSPDQLCEAIEAQLPDPRLVALGEVGLDKGRGAPPERQAAFLEAQLRLAREKELPVICHQVGLRDEFLRSLERAGGCPQGGVVHGFGGDTAWAKALVHRGLSLGVGAGILRAERKRLREAIGWAPWSHLMLESDEIAGLGPFAAVDRLEQTLLELAALKGEEPGQAAERTSKNAASFYGVFPAMAPPDAEAPAG